MAKSEKSDAAEEEIETQLVSQFAHFSVQNSLEKKYMEEKDDVYRENVNLRRKNKDLVRENENLKKQLQYKDLRKDEEDGAKMRKGKKITQKVRVPGSIINSSNFASAALLLLF